MGKVGKAQKPVADNAPSIADAGRKGVRCPYEEAAFWDAWYKERGDVAMDWSAPVSEALLSRVRTILAGLREKHADGRPLRVCELGCGASSLAPSLASHEDGAEVEVCGVDFSSEVVDLMKKRHPDLEWRCADALELSTEFPAGSFDVVVAKTLLDCFLTRKDAESAVRKLLEEVRAVLPEHGYFVLVDRAASTAYIPRARVEPLAAGSAMDRPMWLRLLRAKTHRGGAEGAEGAEGSDAETGGGASPTRSSRWEVLVRPAPGGLATRRVGGGLVIQSASDFATEVGLRAGDRLLGMDRSDGKGLIFGDASRMQGALNPRFSGLKGSTLRLLVERPPDGKQGAAVRRSMSQSDHLVRLQRAKQLNEQQGHHGRKRSTSRKRASAGGESEDAGSAAAALGSITEAVDMTRGLFE